jgi:hypothetical protein
MSDIKSNKDQFQALADNPSEEPFVMLNLLKFKKDFPVPVTQGFHRQENDNKKI